MTKKPPIFISASVLSADFAHLADEVQRAEQAGVDSLHIDIMDGHFVPNLSMGPKIVAAINRSTDLFLHVHLMTYNPFEFIESFVEAGADQMSFHFEATEDIEDTLEYIRRCNVKSAIALNPKTSVSFLPRFFPLLDEVLVMSVNPGFGGQAFIPSCLEKITELRTYLDDYARSQKAPPINIAVDGGINDTTAPLCAKAGANLFVSGTYLFLAKDMAQAISSMRQSVSTPSA